jgi:MYXO-CTERM domain-containing protein
MKVTGICAGCIGSVARDSSSTSTPAPLLVTIHGDWGPMAPELHAAWERFAAPRGFALLSLACPSELGCKRSWWVWNGEPAWISEQVDRFASRHAIDRDRLWLAGWSGGATYMGMHTQELERTFAALVFHGGGRWPSRADCAPEKAAVVFLAGDQNPLHANVLGLRRHYEKCDNEITFTLLPGAEHAAEWSALDKHGGRIADLLATKRRRPVAVAAAAAAAAAADAQQDAEPSAVAPPPPSPPVPPPTAPPPHAAVPPRAGCACDVASGSSSPSWLLAAGVLALVARRRSSAITCCES